MRSDRESAPLRVVIVDDHPVSRASHRALLRTEGVDVLAAIALGDGALGAIQHLAPDIVVVDVAPDHERAFEFVRRLGLLPAAPRIVLTSSTDRADFGRSIEGHSFVAKGDVCAHALTRVDSITRLIEQHRRDPPF